MKFIKIPLIGYKSQKSSTDFKNLLNNIRYLQGMWLESEDAEYLEDLRTKIAPSGEITIEMSPFVMKLGLEHMNGIIRKLEAIHKRVTP